MPVLKGLRCPLLKVMQKRSIIPDVYQVTIRDGKGAGQSNLAARRDHVNILLDVAMDQQTKGFVV